MNRVLKFVYVFFITVVFGASLKFRTISYESVLSLIKNPDTNRFYLIDVRQPNELIEQGEIANTTLNIPVNDLQIEFLLSPEGFLEKYGVAKPETTSKIIFTCRSGRRAKIAADKVLFMGYWNLFVYEGSMNEWKAKDGPLARPLN